MCVVEIFQLENRFLTCDVLISVSSCRLQSLRMLCWSLREQKNVRENREGNTSIIRIPELEVGGRVMPRIPYMGPDSTGVSVDSFRVFFVFVFVYMEAI